MAVVRPGPDDWRRWRALRLAALAEVSLAAPDPTDKPLELISLWVAPAARGTGAADAAVEAVLEVARTEHPGRPVALSVHVDNGAAVRLYARHGFVPLVGGAGVSPDDDRERRMVRELTAPGR